MKDLLHYYSFEANEYSVQIRFFEIDLNGGVRDQMVQKAMVEVLMNL